MIYFAKKAGQAGFEPAQGKGHSSQVKQKAAEQPHIYINTTKPHHVHDGETILYRGGALVDLRPAINQDVTPMKISLEKLQSRQPTDFTSVGFATYYSKQKALADVFANYALKRLHDGKYIDVGIMYLAIPTATLSPMVEVHTSHWKEFVWRMRLMEHDDLPEHLQTYYDAEILSGGMLRLSTPGVMQMKAQGQNYTHLQPTKLPDGSTASQHCFKSVPQVQVMNQVARVWIEQCPRIVAAAESSGKG